MVFQQRRRWGRDGSEDALYKHALKIVVVEGEPCAEHLARRGCKGCAVFDRADIAVGGWPG